VFTSGGVDIPEAIDIGQSLVTDFDFRLDDERTPSDASVTLAKLEPTLSAALTNVKSPFFVTSTTGVLNAETAADSANKTARYGVPRFTGTTPHYGVILQSTSTANLTLVGGGSTAGFAATAIRFLTAPDATTPTGTIRAFIDGSGIAYFLKNVRIGEPTSAEDRLLAMDAAAGRSKRTSK
jgi:hypothetical protein